jgi:hypothetical protein
MQEWLPTKALSTSKCLYCQISFFSQKNKSSFFICRDAVSADTAFTVSRTARREYYLSTLAVGKGSLTRGISIGRPHPQAGVPAKACSFGLLEEKNGTIWTTEAKVIRWITNGTGHWSEKQVHKCLK